MTIWTRLEKRVCNWEVHSDPQGVRKHQKKLCPYHQIGEETPHTISHASVNEKVLLNENVLLNMGVVTCKCCLFAAEVKRKQMV